MGRRSSLHEHFVHVKTHMGLERFEVENLELFPIFPGSKFSENYFLRVNVVQSMVSFEKKKLKKK